MQLFIPPSKANRSYILGTGLAMAGPRWDITIAEKAGQQSRGGNANSQAKWIGLFSYLFQ